VSAPPRSADEFDAYLAKAARGSRISGVLGLVGLTLVLAALLFSVRQLSESRRQLTDVSSQVDRKRTELASTQQQLDSMRKELRVVSDSLVREREGYSAYRNRVREESPALAQTAAQVARDSARAARVVYIQFRGGLSRATANALRARLNAGGFNAPGVERIDRQFGNSVRYFHAEDAGAARSLAQAASAFFAEQGCQASFREENLSDRGGGVPVGQIEIWINLNCRPAASVG
jgi:hypothetical protein